MPITLTALTNGLGPTAITVAASNAPSVNKRRSDYICDGSNDWTQIQAAVTAATSLGGVVALSAGTFTRALGSSSITLPAGVQIIGAGRGATIINDTSSNTASLFTATNVARFGLDGLRINPASTITDHAIKTTNANYFHLRDLDIRGGPTDSSIYLIAIRNSFDAYLTNIYAQPNGGGLRMENTDNAYNYGNSVIEQVEFQPQQPNMTCVYISGYQGAGSGNYNIMCFNYLSVTPLTANGVGATGLKIVNSSYIKFNTPDLEQCATSLDISGAVSGGPGSNGNTFINGYIDSSINLDANTAGTVFVGGRLNGTITDTQTDPLKSTTYLNCLKSGNLIQTDIQVDKTISTAVGATTTGTWNTTVSGAKVGDTAYVNFTSGTIPAGLIPTNVYVSATNTVTVEFYNTTGSSKTASGTGRVTVLKRTL